jgi:large-conductance mechanosensitive channel
MMPNALGEFKKVRNSKMKLRTLAVVIVTATIFAASGSFVFAAESPAPTDEQPPATDEQLLATDEQLLATDEQLLATVRWLLIIMAVLAVLIVAVLIIIICKLVNTPKNHDKSSTPAKSSANPASDSSTERPQSNGTPDDAAEKSASAKSSANPASASSAEKNDAAYVTLDEFRKLSEKVDSIQIGLATLQNDSRKKADPPNISDSRSRHPPALDSSQEPAQSIREAANKNWANSTNHPAFFHAMDGFCDTYGFGHSFLTFGNQAYQEFAETTSQYDLYMITVGENYFVIPAPTCVEDLTARYISNTVSEFYEGSAGWTTIRELASAKKSNVCFKVKRRGALT